MRASLDALRTGQGNIASLCSTWRAQEEVMTALPPRYRQVAEDLLGRLEAGSLSVEFLPGCFPRPLQLVLWSPPPGAWAPKGPLAGPPFTSGAA